MLLREIHLESRDLKSTKDFYVEIMNLDMLHVSDQQLCFLVGDTTLFFHLTRSGNPLYHLAFDLPENQLDRSFIQMEKKIPILPVDQYSKMADFSNWNARSFYFLDNNGNILEFICRYDNHLEANEPIISHISEIGLVVSNVPDFTQRLLREYPLDIYSKQSPSDQFTVIGAEDGLFIVVEESRTWYPTTKKSEKFWTKISFSVGGNDFTLHLSGKDDEG